MKRVNFMLFGAIGISLLLAFIIPTIQWFVSSLGLISTYAAIVSSILVIAGSYLWYFKTKTFSFLPSSWSWKIFCLLGGLGTLILVFLNINNESISQITGQTRSALSVINVIILLPLAEELIFRGHLWSFFEKVSVKNRFKITLLGTSILFGIAHLGYWLQFYWPLPTDAVFHALLMVLAGLCLGLVRWFSGSLWATIIVHSVANGIVLLFQ